MISYIQNKLQKHNKILFFTLLAVTIVAFVFMGSGNPGMGGNDQTVRHDFFGYNLASERDWREMSRPAQLSHRISVGEEDPNPERFQNYVLERIAYLGLADKLRIPAPTEDQLKRFIASREAFQDEEGRFDSQEYSNFIDEIDANPQVSTDDVGRVIEEDFRIEKAREIVTGPGYVLPTEVRLQLERGKTLWSVDLARMNLEEFDPEIEVTDEKLAEFFEENAFRYEREPQVSFSYALFPRDAFLDQVREPSEEDLQRHFEQNRAKFAAMKAEKDSAAKSEDEEAAQAEETEAEPEEEVALADVRDEVEEEVRRLRARRLSGEAAADFAYALFVEPEARPGDPRFHELLEKHGGELRDAPPATQREFPPQLGFPPQVQERVFRLNEDRDFSDPLALRDDHIVLIYQETLPSYLPPLEEIREVVERDYKSQERRRLISELGEELREKIRNRMEEGASFVEAAEAEGLNTESADEFSRMSPPEGIDRQLSARLDEFKVGEVSAMIPQQTSGVFVYVRDREVPAIDRSSSEFVSTEENLRSWSSMVAQNYVLQEFIQREMPQTN